MNANTKSDANMNANESGETGTQLRERLRVHPRTFQAMWKRKLEYPFDANKVCTRTEIEAMELAYKGKVKMKRVLDKPAAAKVLPSDISSPVSPVLGRSDIFKTRKIVLLAALIIPTLASVSNTFLVSHALSNNQSTAALITGVASATSLLFLWAGVRGIGAWFVVAATLGFEAFCNACSVFKAVMGSMAYSLTTVSGKPSDFLDMVANFTGKDHQDAATAIACFTALMICGAQVSAIYELKK